MSESPLKILARRTATPSNVSEGVSAAFIASIAALSWRSCYEVVQLMSINWIFWDCSILYLTVLTGVVSRGIEVATLMKETLRA